MALENKWRVVDGKLDDGSNLVSMGCNHRNGVGACGGCYARTILALREVVDTNASGAANDVLVAIRAERGGK